MFADDTVMCHESREQIENTKRGMRYDLEKSGMKVKTCKDKRGPSGTQEVASSFREKCGRFIIPGSTVQPNGE